MSIPEVKEGLAAAPNLPVSVRRPVVVKLVQAPRVTDRPAFVCVVSGRVAHQGAGSGGAR